MQTIGPYLVGVAFWVFIGAVAIAGMITDYKRRRGGIEVLRLAITGRLRRVVAQTCGELLAAAGTSGSTETGVVLWRGGAARAPRGLKRSRVDHGGLDRGRVECGGALGS